MPFTNWTVWNTVDPETREIPLLADTAAATRKLRGSEYPFIEYKGYMIKPWHPDVQARNTAMFETYTTTYPQDLMFVDMTGERSWRYLLMDDNETRSVAAYTQGVVNENVRLSEIKPLFTEGVFDRIGNSVTGYAQTLRQKFWNGILLHLGEEFEHWVPYPFAADVMHTNVAFYQHDLNLEVWPAEEKELFTYYSTYGYNFMIDLSKHFGEDLDVVLTADTFQKVVNSRTFGEPLADYKTLTDDLTVVQTRWGAGENDIVITANFDPTESGKTYQIGNSTISPDGFYAETIQKDVMAGIFVDRFNGQALSEGEHWITVETRNGFVTVNHAQGTGYAA